ncbi:hypothetical protein V6Z11_A05G276400 [Gossypium hirsutum]
MRNTLELKNPFDFRPPILGGGFPVVHDVGKLNTGKRWWRHVPLGSGWKWVVEACG